MRYNILIPSAYKTNCCTEYENIWISDLKLGKGIDSVDARGPG